MDVLRASVMTRWRARCAARGTVGTSERSRSVLGAVAGGVFGGHARELPQEAGGAVRGSGMGSGLIFERIP